MVSPTQGGTPQHPEPCCRSGTCCMSCTKARSVSNGSTTIAYVSGSFGPVVAASGAFTQRKGRVHAQPEADKMAALLRFRIVLEGRAVVQNPPVVDEKQITGLQRELDTQGRIICHFVERIERLPLDSAQRLAGLVVAGLNPVTQITVLQTVSVPGQHRVLYSWSFAGPHAAAAIDVPWLIEDF